MPLPLAEVMRRVEVAKSLRKDLGREAMTQCCLNCQAPTCNTKASGCLARQLKSERAKAYYHRTRKRRQSEARRYYRKNKQSMRARSAAYQRDPKVLEIMAAKRRASYAKRTAEQGRTVRPYQRSAPNKNKPNKTESVA